jgi:hypothetical protein
MIGSTVCQGVIKAKEWKYTESIWNFILNMPPNSKLGRVVITGWKRIKFVQIPSSSLKEAYITECKNRMESFETVLKIYWARKVFLYVQQKRVKIMARWAGLQWGNHRKLSISLSLHYHAQYTYKCLANATSCTIKNLWYQGWGRAEFQNHKWTNHTVTNFALIG